ncbi:MAG: hypothetical protein IPK16_29140 [Anaerolineales bacterium]|nr:hypothetical protein [Anaerolineales bacterium]
MLTERTEGWAAGLRLAALTLRYGGNLDSYAAGLHTENRYVIDYLVNEVFSHVPAKIEDFLVKTSILDTLSGSLCDAVVAMDGAAVYLQRLVETNSFTVSLDEQGLWYLYHPLFRGFLRSRLAHKLDAQEIDELHRRASAWYASHDSIELALQHALAGHDTPGAVQLVANHRHALLDTEQRPRLERWLRLFPAATLAQEPELLLSKAWIAEVERLDAHTVLDALDRAQALVEQMAGQSARARQLQGEIDAIRSIEKTFAANDPEGVIMLATRPGDDAADVVSCPRRGLA